MGVVYQARQVGLNRLVALKMIRAGASAEASDLARFRTEAETVARLQHPNVVQIYEVGDLGGLPFFSMEYCLGGSLDKKLGGTPLPPVEAATLLRTLANAVQAAHSAGVVHRDLKPANVLLDAAGTPKVSDFGLARKLDEAVSGDTGVLLGTPEYMAPEQAEGKGRAVGPLADVYTLGVILYECLIGRPPFKAANKLDIIVQVVTEEPVQPRRLNPSVPRDLETICLKAMAKEPVRRYQTAADMAEDLRRYLEGRPIVARPVGAVERGVRWCNRNRALAAAFGGIAASLVLGTVVSIGFAVQANGAAEQANREAVRARASEESERVAHAATEAEKQHVTEEKDRTTLAFYVAQIRGADSELFVHNLQAARRSLNETPPGLRGWEYGYLARRAEGTPFTLRGHTGNVTSVAFSPDGTRLVSGSVDGTVKLWDTLKGAEISILCRPVAPVISVAFSPDGIRLATSGARDKTVKLWDARSGAELLILRGHVAPVNSVVFSPEGTRLASGAGTPVAGEAQDNTVKLWDARSGAELLTLRGHAAPVHCVAFSPDGTRLASAAGGILLPGNAQDNTVKLWDARSGAEILTLRGHDSEVTSVAFSPDGTRLASGAWDNTVKLWDARTGAELLTLRGHSNWVRSVAFSPDGMRLASGTQDNTVKLWDARNGAELFTLRGHIGAITSVAFSPDGTRLASGAEDNTVKLWDARNGAEIPTLRGNVPITSIAFSSDGTRLASAAFDSTVKLWDLRSGTEVLTLRGHVSGNAPVAFSPDGSRLATSDAQDNSVKLWDARSGAELLTLRGHTAPVYCVAFSPDGTRLASGAVSLDPSRAQDNFVKLWDARNGAELLTLPGHASGVTSIAFSPDSTRLLSGSHYNTVKLWDAQNGAELFTIRAHLSSISSVAFSPDGTRLATSGGLDSTVKLWDARNGAELRSLRGHAVPVACVAFSPDGTRLASGAFDHTIKLWDARSGAELLTLRGHVAPVDCVAFSPDGSRLASGSTDCTVKVWDARSSAKILALRGHAAALLPVAFSPDGTRLASGAEDNTMKLWDAHSGAEILTFDGHDVTVTSIAFSPDGARVAGGAYDNSVKLWDTRNGTEVVSFAGHDAPVTSVRFESGGKLLESRDISGKTITREVASGKAVEHKLTNLIEPPHESPDGKWKVCADGGRLFLISQEKPKDGNDIWGEDEFRRRSLAASWHLEDAEGAAGRGDPFATAFHLARLDEIPNLGPRDLYRRGLSRLRVGRQDGGLADLADPALARDTDLKRLGWHAVASIASGQSTNYRAACARLLSLFGSDVATGTAYDAAWYCCLGPAAAADFAPVIALAEKAVAVKPRDGNVACTLGATLLRAGRTKEALNKLEEAIRLPGEVWISVPDTNGPRGTLEASAFQFPKLGAASVRLPGLSWECAHNELLLAIAHHQLGHAEEARRWLNAAAHKMDRYRVPASACGTLGVGHLGGVPVATSLLAKRPDRRPDTTDSSLRRWLEMDILRAEAEAALAGPPHPERPK
jgi:WD40 repeat protein/tetratricopeptide (TPR) repeat protein